MNKILYSFFWDVGRMGKVDGIFISDKDAVENAIGKNIYFGEILGKHSEVYGPLEEEDLGILSEDQEFINKCLEIFKSPTLSGYNPLNYLPEDDEED